MTTSNDMVRREEATTEHVRAEHRLYPACLRLVAEGKARLEDGRVILAGRI